MTQQVRKKVLINNRKGRFIGSFAAFGLFDVAKCRNRSVGPAERQSVEQSHKKEVDDVGTRRSGKGEEPRQRDYGVQSEKERDK